MQDQKTKDFIAKAEQVHGSRYDYSLSNYVNANKKIKFICAKHGQFEQTPRSHLKCKVNCPICVKEENRTRNKNTKEKRAIDIIDEIRDIHKEKVLLDKFKYLGNNGKSLFGCGINASHGYWKARCTDVLYKKSGCPKCNKERLKTIQENSKNKAASEAINRLKERHGDKLLLDRFIYNGAGKKSVFGCNVDLTHGYFERTFSSMLVSHYCPKCSKITKGGKTIAGVISSTEEAIQKIIDVHGSEILLDKFEFNGSKSLSTFGCAINSKHGYWQAKPNSVIVNKSGCPKCANKNVTQDEAILKIENKFGDVFLFDKFTYFRAHGKVIIGCKKEPILHGYFEVVFSDLIQNNMGCPFCNGVKFTKEYKLKIIQNLQASDLLKMDPFEIHTIISQGKLPIEFNSLVNSEADSDERRNIIQELKNSFLKEEATMKVKKPAGFWDIKENCLLIAKEFNSPNELSKTYSAAYKSIRMNKWQPEAFAHMKVKSKPTGYWNVIENCIDVSKNYNSPSELEKNYPGAYTSIYKHKWQELCYSHMKRNNPEGFYTLKVCKEISLNYDLPSDLQNANSMAYSVIIKNKWQDVCFSHMENKKKPKGFWDIKENCLKVALECKSPSELEINYGGAYAKICENNWKEEAYAHMLSIKKENNFFTKENCIKISLQYSSIQEIREKDNSAYQIICRNNWNAECFSHMNINVFTQALKLSLINYLGQFDLLTMDPFEIYSIIGQGKLPAEFNNLANTEAGSEERVATLQELKRHFSKEESIENQDVKSDEIPRQSTGELVAIDDVDDEVLIEENKERALPTVSVLQDMHSIDNALYASMDEEVFNSLVQYKLKKLWNSMLNQEVTLESMLQEDGGKYFTTIKNLFLEEYQIVSAYKPKGNYCFGHQPNLMQKLTVIRVLKNRFYGNWSGTGAGKTLSFILVSREIESKLTIIIALNSTIKQTCDSIKKTYPDSVVDTSYKKGQVFDVSKHNYLVLNYEKFQQEYSEELFQDLTNNHKIDFFVVDEVQNTKQRQEDEESIRRGVLNRLLGRARERNSELYTLVMSATPVVNNLYEAKSLLQLMTGLEYNDIETRRTLGNALKIFQQLTLNGIRFIPKYDIDMSELTGSNMSNLNIDGTHLLEDILLLSSNNYIAIEKLLLPDKLRAIQPYLRKGVIIYSYFTTGFISEIQEYIQSCGYSTATYTGEESLFIREDNLSKFIAGDIDILIGSKPIGTGVDGLQSVSNRMIKLTLPWTHAEDVQLNGRIYRQGSSFGEVEIIIPQVRIALENGESWSWDVQRLNVIKNKKTLADAAVDGLIPSKVLPSPHTMFQKAQESLQRWKDRINNGDLIAFSRRNLQVNLYPEIINSEQRQQRIQSELSEFNRRAKTTKSSTMHQEFVKSPESWFRYHTLRKERMQKWDEIPYEYIATKIRNKNHRVVDFGCGENLFKKCISSNEVISFDHVAFDDTVIACDMKDVSQWLENESVDRAVFSLSLWGTNYIDYIQEAYRILNYGGVIHIGEPAKDYDTDDKKQELMEFLTQTGFEIVGNIENRGKFIYISGLKT